MYIIVNCAMSVDGKIALPSRKQTRISNEKDMMRVHKLRNSVDAILVGIGTILTDNPILTVKKKYVKNPRNPIRIILDTHLRIPEHANVLGSESKTIIVTTANAKKRKFANAEIIICGKNKINLKTLIHKLEKRKIKKILIEGGGTVIWSFLRDKLVDEINVFIGNMIIGGKTAPTMADGDGAKRLNDIVHLKLLHIENLTDGVLLKYKVIK